VDVREVNKLVIEQFRAGGEIEGMHRDRLVLLTTTGARTGRPHTTPVMFQQDGDRLVVIASNAGAPQDPDWYHNLVAEPRVTVEVGQDSYQAAASVLTGAEREQRWAALTAAFPFIADHERQAARTIPIVALTRLPAGE
jgi:deazaflavin-dependent oxidoreductase (nitroreductase family)